ncbi:YeeE/YedE family protein [Bradyrhizobium sp. CCGUVB1N3]|uniref:YeeE/YedE family protein n=1 Tax=Bradyrhizobium sp. CCGUVB1N3 TaxID=2949629 RepID=UPI0020B2DD43|nr:YeeE/YedE family protein [Bradyrhizobium sp. CCGUVB1N3]MCP3473381.1 YeeE/YedE family protein [Bradyrhizobium sp. CCGUVB1N3]
MSVLIQFAIGLIFGVGLLISGMSNPAKVLNFLDLAGSWDPSLMFVMLGAVATAFIGFRLVLKRQRPLLGDTFHLPARNDLDPRVIVGPAIFGVGWGLAGFCPGPAFVALGYGTLVSVLFVIAMMVGMAAARALAERQPTLATPSYE